MCTLLWNKPNAPRSLVCTFICVQLLISSFMCTQCGKRFNSTRTLNLHWHEVHEMPTKHKCTEAGCTKEFQSKSSLYNHVRGEHGEGWSCENCGKHFRFPAGYQYHIKVCCIVKKPTTRARKKWNCCISLSFVILLVYAFVTHTWCDLFSVMPILYSGNIGIVMYYCVLSNHEVQTLRIVVYY